jgi:hypothetical protein
MAHRLCSQPSQVQWPAGGEACYLIKTTSSSKNIPLGPLEHSQSHCDAVIEIFAALFGCIESRSPLCLITL